MQKYGTEHISIFKVLYKFESLYLANVRKHWFERMFEVNASWTVWQAVVLQRVLVTECAEMRLPYV